jgi:hypothetical protein
MMAFEAFWRLDMRNLHNVNEALMTLLPKNPDAAEIMDYRPISLIHSIGKLILKVLVNRLAPRMRWCTRAKAFLLKIAISKIILNLCRPQLSSFMYGGNLA